MNNDTNKNGSIKEVLQVILLLQQNACTSSCIDSCDRPMLGTGTSCLMCNTRPVMIYTCSSNGVPWSMPTSKDVTTACFQGMENCSSVFRVEKLDGNCCTFRVLADNPDTTSLNPFIATNSLFTMDLDCLCVCRCLNDTYVDCV